MAWLEAILRGQGPIDLHLGCSTFVVSRSLDVDRILKRERIAVLLVGPARSGVTNTLVCYSLWSFDINHIGSGAAVSFTAESGAGWRMPGSEDTPGSSAASSMVPNQLAALVPTYDPSKDDLEIYVQKIELLVTTWPADKFGELATRLILGCQGTAFLKLQQQKDQVTVNDKKAIQRIVEILGGQWGQIPLERKYEAAERAMFRCQQRSDESNDSFLARADVLWQDLLKKGMKMEELQAYVTLRGSNLGPEDKKKVILDCDSSDGQLSMKKVSNAVRMLGAGFFSRDDIRQEVFQVEGLRPSSFDGGGRARGRSFSYSRRRRWF